MDADTLSLDKTKKKHELSLHWTRIVTQTHTSGTEGEVYEATTGSNLVHTITVRAGRHPDWPTIWHLSAESGDQAQRIIVGAEPEPGLLMRRLEVFAERWALAGTMPNVL